MGSYPNPWFLVELAPLGYSPKQDTLADASTLATRLGPKTGRDEAQQFMRRHAVSN
jgi:hypothetical protein